MKYGIEKCYLLKMKSRNRKKRKVKELPNQESMKTQGEKENSKYLRISEADTIKQAEMKREKKKKKDYLRRTIIFFRNQTLQQKFQQRNKHLISPTL